MFNSYEEDQTYDTSLLPTDNQDEIDQFVKRFSLHMGYNLAPLFDFWNFPLSAGTYAAIEHLTPYLPDDSVINHV